MKENALVFNYTVAQYKIHGRGCNESKVSNIVDRQFDNRAKLEVAYIVREKEANAGKYPTMRLKAELVKTEIPNEYEVYYKGENINIYNFGGRLAYTIDNDETHGYFPKAAKNSLTISEEDIYNPNLKVYIITDLGKVYVARYYNGPK